MFFQKVFVVLISLLITSSAQAQLIHVDTERLFSWTSPDAYRQELLNLQTSDNVCKVSLQIEHAHVHLGARAVKQLTPEMLAIIFKMHKQLEHDRSFRHHVAGLVERDLEDTSSRLVIPSEYGGLGILVGGILGDTIELLPIPHRGRLSIKSYTDILGHSVSIFGDNNRTYHLPSWSRESISHVLEFHIHAISDTETRHYCSPSFGVGESLNGLVGDIGNAIYLLIQQGRVHEFVFANLGGSTYSVVYYGGEMKDDGSWFISVISLPNVVYK